MHISEILKKKGSNVFTVRPKDRIGDAVRLFRERKIGAVPVVDPNTESGGLLAEPDILRAKSAARPIGLLTERDVLHAIADHGPEILDQPVEKLMKHEVVTCKPDDGYHFVMRLMIDKHVRHVLVVAGGQIKGIVSVGDMMRNRLDESQLEIDVMREYTRLRPQVE